MEDAYKWLLTAKASVLALEDGKILADMTLAQWGQYMDKVCETDPNFQRKES